MLDPSLIPTSLLLSRALCEAVPLPQVQVRSLYLSPVPVADTGSSGWNYMQQITGFLLSWAIPRLHHPCPQAGAGTSTGEGNLSP